MIVDAHLDLAHNVVDLGRNLLLPLEDLRARDHHPDIPVVTLPSLRRGGVALCFATLWVSPSLFPDPQSAHIQALRQLEVYQRWEELGYARIVRNSVELESHLTKWKRDKIPGLLILIEGAEPIREPGEVAFWRQQGVRLIGPAWRRTRYCGGTSEPGGLTDLGVELLHAMDEARVGLDFAHMDEEAFWEALEVFKGPVCASHANPRRFIPSTNRHLGDPMIRAIGQRQGVIGIVLFNAFLVSGWQRGMDRVGLNIVQEHLEHVAGQIGWDKVGIGSDFDGGFGRDDNPQGLDEPADLRKLSGLVPVEQRENILNANWLRWLKGWL